MFDRRLKILLLLSILFTLLPYPLILSIDLKTHDLTSLSLMKHQGKGTPPVPLIRGWNDGVNPVFNDQVIHLDASPSYDGDGSIVRYTWCIGDEILHGKEVDYRISAEVDSLELGELPILCVSLLVEDDSGNTAMRVLLLRILPNMLYLSRDGLTPKPERGRMELVMPLTGCRTLTYRFDTPLKLPCCKVDLHIKKRGILRHGLREVSLYAILENGGKILVTKGRVPILGDSIDLSGRIGRDVVVSGFEIRFTGLPLSRIDILTDQSYIGFS